MDDIATQILVLGIECGVLATVVSSTVAAIRPRLAKPDGSSMLDGWLVLVAAAMLSLGIVALFVRPADAASAARFAQLAVFTWLLSIGVPALGNAIAAKAGTTKRIEVVEAPKHDTLPPHDTPGGVQ